MFKYDEKKDAWAYEMIKGIEEIWGNRMLKIENDKEPITTKYLINYLNNYLEDYGQKILEKFSILTGISYKNKDLNYYVNTTPVSLHSSSEHFISIGGYHSFISYPTVVIHEICHIFFHDFVRSENFLSFSKISDISEILSIKQENELKEIVTVIINLEFLDLIAQKDQGYPNHQSIRHELEMLWLNKPDFTIWISEAIKIYKKDND
jgi:hypothetical protein